jgi:hypothetical protein
VQKEKIIKTLLFTPRARGRWGLPMLFEGSPGIGKSSRIESPESTSGMSVWTLIATIREPSDFLGLPMPSGGDGSSVHVRYAPPSWAMEAAECGRAVVFFDEINSAPPAVQAALLRVILDGAVGDYQLPGGVRFVAAQNNVSEAAGGHVLAPPLANRFGHFDWHAPTADEWAAWLATARDSQALSLEEPEALEARVLEVWPNHWARARGLVAGYIRSNPSALTRRPEPGNPNLSRAWASPRTWEMAARAMAGAWSHGISDEDSIELVAAFVSLGSAATFYEWVEGAKIPSVTDLLDGRISWRPSIKRLDVTFAVVTGGIALLSADETKAGDTYLTRVENFYKILLDVAKTGALDVVQYANNLARVSCGISPRDLGKKFGKEDNPIIKTIFTLEPMLMEMLGGAA